MSLKNKVRYNYLVRIAFLSFYNGLNLRGVETFVHELGNRLTGMGHAVTVYQYGPKLKNTAYEVGSLANTYSLPDMLYPPPDIIFPLNGRIQAVRARIWAFTNHKKIIISGQSGPGLDDRLNLYTFPDAFIGLTDFQCVWAKKTNPWAKVVKIPNGVDTRKFNPQVSPLIYHLPQPVVLYVAALEPIKRQELLIKAIAKTKASLLLVGQGSQSEFINSMCQDLLPGRYKIMALSPNEMPSVYASCAVFTYPTSPWESFGIAILEAMASGLPVVADDDPIRKEIIGDAGLLVNPENTDLYAASIDKVLAEKWGNKPVVRAGFYNWDKIAADYAALFTDLFKAG
jgi:glycosyltransferase involved in cell wall biosynthesis